MENLKTKVNSLTAQMNPHFLFNALTQLRNFTQNLEAEDADRAIKALSWNF